MAVPYIMKSSGVGEGRNFNPTVAEPVNCILHKQVSCQAVFPNRSAVPIPTARSRKTNLSAGVFKAVCLLAKLGAMLLIPQHCLFPGTPQAGKPGRGASSQKGRNWNVKTQDLKTLLCCWCGRVSIPMHCRYWQAWLTEGCWELRKRAAVLVSNGDGWQVSNW